MGAKKALSLDGMGDAFRRQRPGEQNADNLEEGIAKIVGIDDAPRNLTLSLGDVLSWEKNARVLPNSAKPSLKEKIYKQGGLGYPLVITKRPGDEHYTIYKGGNTRLEILKELHAEHPDDRRFNDGLFYYSPYSGNELDIYISHDSENNDRGDLTFVERALEKATQFSVFKEMGLGTEAKEFLSYLKEQHGSNVSKDAFSRLMLAVDYYQHIPHIMLLGKMSNKELRALHSMRIGIREAWVTNKLGNVAQFEAVFFDALSSQERRINEVYGDEITMVDSEKITVDVQVLRDALVYQFVYATDNEKIDSNYAELIIGAALNKGGFSESDDGQYNDDQMPGTLNAGRQSPTKIKQKKKESAVKDTHIQNNERTIPETALLLASRYNLEDKIKLAQTSSGYLVTDILSDEHLPVDWSVVDNRHPINHPTLAAWSILLICSDTLNEAFEVIKHELPDSSTMKTSILTKQSIIIVKAMGLDNPARMPALIKSLSEEDHPLIMELFISYIRRALKTKS